MSELTPEFLQWSPHWRTPEFEPWVSPRVPWEECSETRKAALRKVWAAGDLSYMLDPEQKLVYDEFRKWFSKSTVKGRHRRGKKFGFDCARRFGKSSIAFLIAVEERIRNPYTKRIAYFCDTKTQAENIIVREVLPWLTMDCPPEMRPTWERSRKRILWRHENRDVGLCRSIDLLGFDDPDSSRGGSLYFGVIDECGFINDLEYVDLSVVSKMVLTLPDAAVLYTSTPPLSPGHYWSATLVPQLKVKRAYVKRTIFDCPRLSNDVVAQEIEDTGGFKNSRTKRELLAEHDPDESMAILPEAAEAFRSGTCIWDPEQNRAPEYRNCYTALDPGWSDATGLLFGWIDWENGHLVIEDEWLQPQAPSSVVADVIKDKEYELWHDVRRYDTRTREILANPHRRFTDIDKRLVNDLDHDHGLRFSYTKKDNLTQQINRVRNWLLDGTIKIHPRCKQLRAQMVNGIFINELRRTFARVEKFGHFDLISALIYMCRNVEPLLRRSARPPKILSFNEIEAPKENDAAQKKREKQAARQERRINVLTRRSQRRWSA